MSGFLQRDRPGRYAERRFKELRDQWQRRIFPRTRIYAGVTAGVLALLGWILLDQPFTAFVWGIAVSSLLIWAAIVESFIADHVVRWQRGGFGDQHTAKELKRLAKQGWVARHDLQTGFANRDHVLVGNGLYLLESKTSKIQK